MAVRGQWRHADDGGHHFHSALPALYGIEGSASLTAGVIGGPLVSARGVIELLNARHVSGGATEDARRHIMDRGRSAAVPAIIRDVADHRRGSRWTREERMPCIDS